MRSFIYGSSNRSKLHTELSKDQHKEMDYLEKAQARIKRGYPAKTEETEEQTSSAPRHFITLLINAQSLKAKTDKLTANIRHLHKSQRHGWTTSRLVRSDPPASLCSGLTGTLQSLRRPVGAGSVYSSGTSGVGQW